MKVFVLEIIFLETVEEDRGSAVLCNKRDGEATTTSSLSAFGLVALVVTRKIWLKKFTYIMDEIP